MSTWLLDLSRSCKWAAYFKFIPRVTPNYNCCSNSSNSKYFVCIRVTKRVLMWHLFGFYPPA